MNNLEVIESNVGNIVIDFNRKYHMYTAVLQKDPSVNFQTRFKSSIPIRMEVLLKKA